MERSGNFYKAIRLGYILISILIGCMAYNSLYEWQEIEALELGNKKIDELRKEINNINIQMIKFSLLGETILEWNDKDIEHYHARRMAMDSMLCRFKATYPAERIDSVRSLLEDKERQMFQIVRLMDEQQSINKKIANQIPVIVQKSVQEQSKKPMSMSKTKLAAQIDSLETSFQADIDTCGLLLSTLPDTLASQAYDSYRLKEIGVVYQYAVHPAANKDSLMFIAHSELYQHAIGAWETSNELQRHKQEYFGRTLNTGCIYIAYILLAFLGYLLRYKPIKKILAVFAILIVAAWIYHEINSLVQGYAKKLNTESHQIVDDTYKEIDGIKEQRTKCLNDK